MAAPDVLKSDVSSPQLTSLTSETDFVDSNNDLAVTAVVFAQFLLVGRENPSSCV